MKLCLTIGVSNAAPLENLPGAITVANEMGQWAEKSGFHTKIVTDEGNKPVTIARLRQTLIEMLPRNDDVELFVLHFAGHGFRSGAEQHIWLPSDWHKEMRAVSVEGLRKQLYRHGIQSLSIFSDACRSLPSDIDTADIFGDPILPRGPYDYRTPIVDRFNAVVDGQQAYMLKGDENSPPRCVFSTVLLEGLCGQKDEAFDTYKPDLVIPESLALFSQKRLREIGELYDLKCIPECTTGIPREHAVYFRRNRAINSLPVPTWPAPISHAAVKGPVDGDPPSKNPTTGRSVFGQYAKGILDLRLVEGYVEFNLVVRGAKLKKIWSNASIEFCSSGIDWETYQVRCVAATQIIFQIGDDFFSSAVIYPELTTQVTLDDTGNITWGCVSKSMNSIKNLIASSDAISNLQAGKLTYEQVDEIATFLREDKHVNPTLGAIASYLYDYAGDVDSILRMAYFYCKHGQAMPFDVAFMGMLSRTDKWRLDSNGDVKNMKAHVPPVPARSGARASENLPSWVTMSTVEADGEVAGFWPWLRQGWQFVEDPMPHEEAYAVELQNVSKFLLPSQFSSFKAEGALKLINGFNLRLAYERFNDSWDRSGAIFKGGFKADMGDLS
ncbi:caspase family protein [Acidovorax sp. LjRoot66]|uniref:caspase family protein n=1 Tax=Acidovorax sp. LjRoot66 TaxID=3342334 RepID=UPI003ECFB555